MDDQFHGRTDDDLFYDDLEPVQSDTIVSPPQQQTENIPTRVLQIKDVQTIDDLQILPEDSGKSNRPQPKPSTKPHKSLSSSRFAAKPHTVVAPETALSTTECISQQAPNELAKTPSGYKLNPSRSHNAIADTAARLQSGANPRTKLTDEQLAAKMEEMKVVNAEKTRKFEEAEKDEKEHAAALARGMEEARKRKADETERRRKGEENKKKLESEREKNRERKLKAMSMKDGVWDQDKMVALEAETSKTFRSAHGGVRGTRKGRSDVFASRDEEDRNINRFLDERTLGNTRGRGGRGSRGFRGGGRREGGVGGSHIEATILTNKGPAQTVPTMDDFPSLLVDGKKGTLDPSARPSAILDTRLKTLPQSPNRLDENGRIDSSNVFAPDLPSSPSKKWDEEVEQEEEMIKLAAASAARV